MTSSATQVKALFRRPGRKKPSHGDAGRERQPHKVAGCDGLSKALAKGYTHISMYIHIYIYIYTHTYTHTYIYIYIHNNIPWMYIYIYIYTHVHVCLGVDGHTQAHPSSGVCLPARDLSRPEVVPELNSPTSSFQTGSGQTGFFIEVP